MASVFIGSPQSMLSGIALLIAIIVVSICFIFSKEKTPVIQKIGGAFLLFLICIPIILYNLFQVTCLVTGKGVNGETWWCGIYAWIIATIITIFAILIMIVASMNLLSNKKSEVLLPEEKKPATISLPA